MTLHTIFKISLVVLLILLILKRYTISITKTTNEIINKFPLEEMITIQLAPEEAGGIHILLIKMNIINRCMIHSMNIQEKEYWKDQNIKIEIEYAAEMEMLIRLYCPEHFNLKNPYNQFVNVLSGTLMLNPNEKPLNFR